MTYWNHIVILDMCVFFKECVYVSVTPQRHPNYHTEKIYREEARCVCERSRDRESEELLQVCRLRVT